MHGKQSESPRLLADVAHQSTYCSTTVTDRILSGDIDQTWRKSHLLGRDSDARGRELLQLYRCNILQKLAIPSRDPGVQVQPTLPSSLREESIGWWPLFARIDVVPCLVARSN